MKDSLIAAIAQGRIVTNAPCKFCFPQGRRQPRLTALIQIRRGGVMHLYYPSIGKATLCGYDIGGI